MIANSVDFSNMLTNYCMSSKPMTKEEFINLLHKILREKQQQNKIAKIKYIEPYNDMYNKCLLGYDLSYVKQSYDENKLMFKTLSTVEASTHLKFVIETLVKCYSKEEVVKILKDM